LQEVKEHPEIASREKLNGLIKELNVSDHHPIIGGDLHEVLRTLNRKSLISYALAMDAYDHEKNPRLGGLHDYVYSLQDQEITKFINEAASKYPELNSKQAIESAITRFNIQVKDQ